MKSLFILTVFDHEYFKNNRIHHLISQLKARFDSVTVMYKVHIPYERSILEHIKNFLCFSLRINTRHHVQFIRVNPIFNHAEALGFSLTARKNAWQRNNNKWRQIIWKCLGVFGLISEMGIMLSFLFTYFLVIRQKFDVFIGQGPMEVSVGYILRRLGFVHLLIYDDMDYVPGYTPHKIRQLFLGQLEKFLIKNSDLVFSVGPLLADLRKKQTGRDVLVIPNGADYDLFQKAQEKIPHPPTLLYMGFVEEWSGLEVVLGALCHLINDFPEIRLYILGHSTPQYLKKIKKLSEELGIQGSIFYKGNKSHQELVHYLKEADIGLAVFQPIRLRKYAFSLKVIEYMAAGLPVVTTSNTQSASVVERCHCGMAVPYHVKDLYHCLLSMLKNEAQYQYFVENAKKYSQSFQWENLFDKAYNAIQAIYDLKYTHHMSYV